MDAEDETPFARRKRLALEAQCADIGRTIGGVLPPGVGFVLMLFDFGENGNFAYISSAQREDMLKLLAEARTKIMRQ